MINQTNELLVIGAGQIGQMLAQLFALSGFKVHIVDCNSNQIIKAQQAITDNLSQMYISNLIIDEVFAKTIQNIKFIIDWDTNSPNYFLIIATITESVDTNNQILDKIRSKINEQCIIAITDTNHLKSKLTEYVGFAARLIGLRFIDPIINNSPIEVIVNPQSSPITIENTIAIFKKLNKSVLILKI